MAASKEADRQKGCCHPRQFLFVGHSAVAAADYPAKSNCRFLCKTLRGENWRPAGTSLLIGSKKLKIKYSTSPPKRGLCSLTLPKRCCQRPNLRGESSIHSENRSPAVRSTLTNDGRSRPLRSPLGRLLRGIYKYPIRLRDDLSYLRVTETPRSERHV